MQQEEPAVDFRPPDRFRRGQVEAGGLRLNYWRRGRGRPLLVLHGVTDWGLDWARFARRVEDQLDCVLLDQRGHGYSDKPERGYSYADFAQDAWQVVEQLGLQRPAVLGHSMGGGVALALAAEHGPHLDRLLLVDPAIRLVVPDDQRAATADRQARPRPTPDERRASLTARQALGRRVLLEQLRAEQPDWDDEDVRHTVESTLLVNAAVWQGTERWFDPEAQEQQLHRLACPTLIVRGEPALGAIVSDAAVARIEEVAPPGLLRVTTIPGTGHLPQRQAFERFVDEVLPFLTEEQPLR